MKDLLKLYSFESVHGSEDEVAICDWICKWLDTHNITGYTRVGNNIYKKGKSNIILSAHLDQAKTAGKAVRFFLKQDGTIVKLAPGIAEAFEEFAKKEGLSFFR